MEAFFSEAAVGLLDEIISGYKTGMGLLAPTDNDIEMRAKMAKGLLDMAPVTGDAISMYESIQAARRGDYGEAALNSIGLLPFVPAMGGVLKAGKYPAHGWNLRGQELKDAIKDTGSFYPAGIPENHQADVSSLISEIQNKGLLPFTDVDKGGSVYVSAFSPVKNKNGELSAAKRPERFGKRWESGHLSGNEPFQVRFADHGQYYSGPTLSIDPVSGNSITTAKDMLEYFAGNSAARPKAGKSYIIPATGEQFAFK